MIKFNKKTLRKIGALALCGLIILPGIIVPQENRSQQCIEPIAENMEDYPECMNCNTIPQQLHPGFTSLFDKSGTQTSFALSSGSVLSTTSISGSIPFTSSN